MSAPALNRSTTQSQLVSAVWPQTAPCKGPHTPLGVRADAPALSKRWIVRKHPALAASDKGDLSVGTGVDTWISAPAATRTATNSGIGRTGQQEQAFCRGVQPSSSRMLSEAPAATRARTVLVRPKFAAKWRAVYPSISRASMLSQTSRRPSVSAWSRESHV